MFCVGRGMGRWRGCWDNRCRDLVEMTVHSMSDNARERSLSDGDRDEERVQEQFGPQ